MNSSPSKEKISIISLQSNKSLQPSKYTQQQSRLVQLMKSHTIIKTLTHQKVEILKKYLQESHRTKIIKVLQTTCRNFIEKISPQLFQLLTEMNNRQFALFLKNQKKTDDQKLNKLGRLISDLQPKANKDSWRSPMNKFFQQEKKRFNKKSNK